MMEVLTGSLPTSESADNPSGGKDVTEDDSGPSTVSVSDSEKVKMAQVIECLCIVFISKVCFVHLHGYVDPSHSLKWTVTD